jgi:cell division protein FtsZ
MAKDENVKIDEKNAESPQGDAKVKKPRLKKFQQDDTPIKVNLAEPKEEEVKEEQPKEEVKQEEKPVVEEIVEEKKEEVVEEKEAPVLEEITDEKVEEKVEEVQTNFQTDLRFDLPLKPKTEETSADQNTFNLNVEKQLNINDIEVFGTQEIKVEKKEVEEEEIQFQLKSTKPQSEVNQIETTSEEVSPLDLTISELQQRAEERRKKRKGVNYKFNDQLSKIIDESERQPAYK